MPKPPAGARSHISDAYEAHKRRMAEKSAASSKAGREIGPPPPVVDPDRRASCERNFRLFCESYFPHTFTEPFSGAHLQVIDQIEKSVLHGGLVAVAMPRGSGKTSLAEAGASWAIAYGHRRFVVLIGADEGSGREMMDSIKVEWETNDILSADFPEICHPIEAMEGITNRCAGQTCGGERTSIKWTDQAMVFPTVRGSLASGSILKSRGITGRIRGMKHKTRDGDSLRPDLVIIDDPQTDESAKSPKQVQDRLSVIRGAILGLAGPGKKIAGIMPCTVICKGDVADTVLDRDKSPQWNGIRTQMVESFPENEHLWLEYEKIRDAGMRGGDGGAAATEYYRRHRAKMDAGAKVSWESRYNADELSAIQHAMNLKIDKPREFWAEYQNEPQDESRHDETMAPADLIATKTNGLGRYDLPSSVEHLTAFIDVHDKVLFYCVIGWTQQFGGYICDYGTYPEVDRDYWDMRGLTRTLRDVTGKQDPEAAVYAALSTCSCRIAERQYKRDDGLDMSVEIIMVDAGWGEMTDVVYQFVSRCPLTLQMYPSHGRGIGAKSKAHDDYGKRQGERLGHHWRIPAKKPGRGTRHVLIDTYYWKTFVHAGWNADIGSPGCISLYERKGRHQLFADHQCAEYSTIVEANGRRVREWMIKPGGPDNHWFDCAVGCAVGASILGASSGNESSPAKSRPTRRKMTLAEWKHGGNA